MEEREEHKRIPRVQSDYDWRVAWFVWGDLRDQGYDWNLGKTWYRERRRAQREKDKWKRGNEREKEKEMKKQEERRKV